MVLAGLASRFALCHALIVAGGLILILGLPAFLSLGF